MDFLIFEPTSSLAHWVGKRVQEGGEGEGVGDGTRGGEER